MQLSNGLADPVGLWLGHLLFDGLLSVLISTIIIIIFAVTKPGQFHGLGFFVRYFILLANMIAQNVCSGLSWCSMGLLELYSHTAYH